MRAGLRIVHLVRTVNVWGGHRISRAEFTSFEMMTVLPVLRFALGITFVVAGVLLLAHIGQSRTLFAAWQIPLPGAVVLAIGATDVVCGVLFALGVLTRPVGLLLATIAVGTAITAGRHGGTIYMLAAPVLFIGCVFFAWRSGRVVGIGPVRPPGVQ